MNELPKGPDEESISEDSIVAVTSVLQTLADEINLADFKRYTRKTIAASQQGVDEPDRAKIDEPREAPAP
jgi:hypothetical protein